jgi:hypothetical protein
VLNTVHRKNKFKKIPLFKILLKRLLSCPDGGCYDNGQEAGGRLNLILSLSVILYRHTILAFDITAFLLRVRDI